MNDTETKLIFLFFLLLYRMYTITAHADKNDGERKTVQV